MIGKPSKMPSIWLAMFLLANLSACSFLKSTFLSMGVFGLGCDFFKGKREERYRMRRSHEPVDTNKITEKYKYDDSNEFTPLSYSSYTNESSSSASQIKIKHVDFAKDWEILNNTAKSAVNSVSAVFKDGGIPKLVETANAIGKFSSVLGALGFIPSTFTMISSFWSDDPLKLLSIQLNQANAAIHRNNKIQIAQDKARNTAQNYVTCMQNLEAYESKIKFAFEKMKEYESAKSEREQNSIAKEFLRDCNSGTSCEESLQSILAIVNGTHISQGCGNVLEAIHLGTPAFPNYYYTGSTDFWALRTMQLLKLVTMGAQVVSLNFAFSLGVEEAVAKVGTKYGKDIESLTQEIERRSKRYLDQVNFRDHLVNAAKDHFNSAPLWDTKCKDLVGSLYDVLNKNFGSEAYIIVQCQKRFDDRTPGHYSLTSTSYHTSNYDLWDLDGKDINVGFIPKRNIDKKPETTIKSFGHEKSRGSSGPKLKEYIKRQDQGKFGLTDYNFYKHFNHIEKSYRRQGENLEIIAARDAPEYGWSYKKHPNIKNTHHFFEIKGKENTGEYSQNCGNWIVFGWEN